MIRLDYEGDCIESEKFDQYSEVYQHLLNKCTGELRQLPGAIEDILKRYMPLLSADYSNAYVGTRAQSGLIEFYIFLYVDLGAD